MSPQISEPDGTSESNNNAFVTRVKICSKIFELKNLCMHHVYENTNVPYLFTWDGGTGASK